MNLTNNLTQHMINFSLNQIIKINSEMHTNYTILSIFFIDKTQF